MMELKRDTKEDVEIISIKDRLDVAAVKELRSFFKQEILDAGKKQVVFNCQGLDFIDSTGIGGLLSCLKELTVADGNIFIAALSPKVRMIFEITRLYKIFEIFDTVEDAADRFKQSESAVVG